MRHDWRRLPCPKLVRPVPLVRRGRLVPAGDRGEQGPPGDPGPAGEIGPQGATGLAGERGLQGEPGRDGLPGRDGQPGLPGERGIDGKDGAHGKDGKDGLSLNDFSVEKISDRTIRMTLQNELTTKQRDLTFPFHLYRGYWKRGAEYEAGDSVTFGGSTWIAMTTNPQAQPSEGNPAEWQVAIRRGRDGKDGKDGKDGERGPQGPPGLHHFQA